MPPSECLADAFLDQSPACHWVLREDRVFHRAWGDCSGIFGVPAAELAGKHLSDIFDSDAVAVWNGRVDRVFGGEALRLRERFTGSQWNISFFPIKVEGAIRYAGGLARDVNSWGRAEQDLRQTVLSALRNIEFERGVLSKFLHDSVGQNLTALGLQLDLLRMDLEERPELCGRIAEIQQVLEEIMEQVRVYSYELNPSAVERAGLRAALDRLVGRLRERFHGTLRLNADPSLKVEPKIARALFHIAQEAAGNSVQHAGCSAIEIAVKSTRTGTFLEVKDNGKGFDPADLNGAGRGLGLLSMEHYAAEAGLELIVSSNSETGTVIRATT